MNKQTGIDARKLFVNNLNRCMNEHGIKQSDIVERLGVSSATASDWVNGVKYPRVDAMQALADLLDVPMGELTAEYKNDTNGLREKLRRQPGMRLMLDAVDGATAEEIAQYVNVIKAMRKKTSNDD